MSQPGTRSPLTDPTYQRAWSEFRRRQRNARIAYLGGLAWFVGAAALSIHWRFIADAEFGYLMLPLLAIALLGGRQRVLMHRWRCPRCKKPFFGIWLERNDFRRRCAYCQLPKWSTDPSA